VIKTNRYNVGKETPSQSKLGAEIRVTAQITHDDNSKMACSKDGSFKRITRIEAVDAIITPMVEGRQVVVVGEPLSPCAHLKLARMPTRIRATLVT
jgi:hypothetical protein